MKHTKKIIAAALIVALALGFATCEKAKNDQVKPIDDTSVINSVSTEKPAEKKEKKVTFKAKIEHYNEKTSTPLIVKVKEENKETYTIPTVKPDKKDTYTVETPTVTEKAEVTIAVSPINDDGSLYEIPEKPVETKKENSEVELKLVPKDKVTEKQINDTLTKTKEAMEKGCDELTVEEKNKLLEKQVENSNKADVKKGNETKISEKVKPTGNEKASSEVGEKGSKIAQNEQKPNTPIVTPKTSESTPKTPAVTQEKPQAKTKSGHYVTKTEKVWVPNIVQEDVYTEQPVYEEKPVYETQKVLVAPEKKIKHEKWEIKYLYFYASSKKKVYNKNDCLNEAMRLMELGLPENTTSKHEIHEGPLDNPSFYQWKTDISTYETIPAKYETKTVQTGTKKVQIGTKKVKTGTKSVDKGHYETKETKVWIED